MRNNRSRNGPSLLADEKLEWNIKESANVFDYLS